MNMTMHRREFLVFALVCASGMPAFAQNDVVGIWSAQARTRGGLGAQMIFTADGQVTSTFGALVDIRYEVDGNKIKMIHSSQGAPPPENLIGQEFTIERDKLTIVQGAAGPPLVMTRVGAAHRDAHQIVGDWTYTHPTGVPAIQRFSRDGTLQLSVPFQSHRGPYRIENGALKIEFEGTGPAVYTFKRDGRMLTMRDSKGKEIKFVKFEY